MNAPDALPAEPLAEIRARHEMLPARGGSDDIGYLLAEVERLTRERDEAERALVIFRTSGAVGLLARAESAEAEVATLRATVERVEALAAGPGAPGYRPYAIALPDGVHLAVMLDDLRAALRNKP